MRKALVYLREVLAGRTGEAVNLSRLMALNADPGRLVDPPDGDGLCDPASQQGHVTGSIPPDAAGAEEWAEFDDLLATLGADTIPNDLEGQVRLRDQAIAELTANLEDLRSLGDRLAATERTRAILLDKVADAEARIGLLEHERGALLERVAAAERSAEQAIATARRTESASHAVDEASAAELARAQRANRRLEERLHRTRTRLDERHRTAADRWQELRALKRELRELRKRLPESD